MSVKPSLPSSNIPIMDANGYPNPQWYRYFASLARQADTAAAGEIVTSGGLDGGGTVSDGVTLSIANQGVTDAKLRYSAPTSVIGRMVNSTGPVADIQATADNRALSREGGMLAFRDAIKIKGITVDDFSMTGAAVVSAATPSTHKIAVTIGGVGYNILLA